MLRFFLLSILEHKIPRQAKFENGQKKSHAQNLGTGANLSKK
jgi:hypothetical protein